LVFSNKVFTVIDLISFFYKIYYPMGLVDYFAKVLLISK
jgi:hypothetical protein